MACFFTQPLRNVEIYVSYLCYCWKESERLNDEDLFKVLADLRRPSSLVRRLKCIPGEHSFTTFNNITFHYFTLNYIHYINYIALHYTTLHYIILQTLYYIALHYITSD